MNYPVVQNGVETRDDLWVRTDSLLQRMHERSIEVVTRWMSIERREDK